jgi:hypothetical protein
MICIIGFAYSYNVYTEQDLSDCLNSADNICSLQNDLIIDNNYNLNGKTFELNNFTLSCNGYVIYNGKIRNGKVFNYKYYHNSGTTLFDNVYFKSTYDIVYLHSRSSAKIVFNNSYVDLTSHNIKIDFTNSNYHFYTKYLYVYNSTFTNLRIIKSIGYYGYANLVVKIFDSNLTNVNFIIGYNKGKIVIQNTIMNNVYADKTYIIQHENFYKSTKAYDLYDYYLIGNLWLDADCNDSNHDGICDTEIIKNNLIDENAISTKLVNITNDTVNVYTLKGLKEVIENTNITNINYIQVMGYQTLEDCINVNRSYATTLHIKKLNIGKLCFRKLNNAAFSIDKNTNNITEEYISKINNLSIDYNYLNSELDGIYGNLQINNLNIKNLAKLGTIDEVDLNIWGFRNYSLMKINTLNIENFEDSTKIQLKNIDIGHINIYTNTTAQHLIIDFVRSIVDKSFDLFNDYDKRSFIYIDNLNNYLRYLYVRYQNSDVRTSQLYYASEQIDTTNINEIINNSDGYVLYKTLLASIQINTIGNCNALTSTPSTVYISNADIDVYRTILDNIYYFTIKANSDNITVNYLNINESYILNDGQKLSFEIVDISNINTTSNTTTSATEISSIDEITSIISFMVKSIPLLVCIGGFGAFGLDMAVLGAMVGGLISFTLTNDVLFITIVIISVIVLTLKKANNS